MINGASLSNNYSSSGGGGPEPEAATKGPDPLSMNRRIKGQLHTLMTAFGAVKDAELLSAVHAKLADCVALVQQQQLKQKEAPFPRQNAVQPAAVLLRGASSSEAQRRKRKIFRSNGRRPDLVSLKAAGKAAAFITDAYGASSSLEGIDTPPPSLNCQKTALDVSEIVYMSPSDVERLEASSSSHTLRTFGDQFDDVAANPSYSFDRSQGHQLCETIPTACHYNSAQQTGEEDFEEDDEAAYMSYFGDDRRKQ